MAALQWYVCPGCGRCVAGTGVHWTGTSGQLYANLRHHRTLPTASSACKVLSAPVDDNDDDDEAVCVS